MTGYRDRLGRMVAALVASYPPGSQGASATGAELCAVAADLLDAIDAHCAGRDEMDRGNPLVPPDEPFFIPTTQEDTVVNEVEVSTHVAEPPAPPAQEKEPGVILPPTLDEMAERAKQAREDAALLRETASELRGSFWLSASDNLDAVATRIERGLHGYAVGGE